MKRLPGTCFLWGLLERTGWMPAGHGALFSSRYLQDQTIIHPAPEWMRQRSSQNSPWVHRWEIKSHYVVVFFYTDRNVPTSFHSWINTCSILTPSLLQAQQQLVLCTLDVCMFPTLKAFSVTVGLRLLCRDNSNICYMDKHNVIMQLLDVLWNLTSDP